jgi:hypothetical protein
MSSRVFKKRRSHNTLESLHAKAHFIEDTVYILWISRFLFHGLFRKFVNFDKNMWYSKPFHSLNGNHMDNIKFISVPINSVYCDICLKLFQTFTEINKGVLGRDHNSL